MKKLLLILSICFFVLGLAACGGAPSNNAHFIHEQLKLQVGDSYKVQYVGEDVEVKSADAEIAKVSVTNVVTALKEGQTKLQLVSGDKVLDELALEVTKSSYIPPEEQMDASIYRISLDVTEKRIYPNGNFTINAKVYKNNTVCDDQVEWNYGGSENPIISAISNKNQLTVTGIDYGKTTVTATIGEFTAVCKITVSDINYQVLLAPVLSGITENEITWNAVENAEGYSVSVNGGISYQEVQTTSFNYGDANPLNVRVVALGNGIKFDDSQESKLTQQNVRFSCGDRLLFYTDKTVSGAENTDKTEPVAVDVYATVNGDEVKIENQQFKLANSKVVSMEGNVFSRIKDADGNVKEGEVSIALEGVSDITLTAVVGTPIKTKVDMDTLGFAVKNGTNAELWSAGRIYLLANDIDYATDVSESEKGLRMTDNNTDADLWDRYLIPIAASYENYKHTASRSGKGIYEWGIFGAIGKDGKFFYGTFDGAGYAIKNAVIPYGIMFAYADGEIDCNHGQNFIGSLVYGGKLRNVAFTNLEFEDPLQVAAAGSNNPYYTDANTNVANTKLKTKGYITGSTILANKPNSVNYGQYLAMNASNRTGLVGQMQNAVISNVYVEAAIKSGTYGIEAKNGLIVAHVEADHYANGAIYFNTYGTVENCITKTSYTTSNVNYFGDAGGAINAGMGSVVGYSAVSKDAIKNCFTIGNLDIVLKSGAKVALDTIFTPNPDKFKNNKQSTNCGVYSSVTSLQSAQADALANMSIAKYLG